MNSAELIDGLRCCAESTNVVETCAVEDCPYHPHSWSCIDDMLRDAADAIEAAEKRIAELMPKEGEWISEWGGWRGYTLTVKCSICGAEALYRYDGYDTDVDRVYSRYCPNCGARMKGEKDGES